MKIIIFYGLKRSGNHFILSSIMQHFKNSVHINNLFYFNYKNFVKYKQISITKREKDHSLSGIKGADCVILSLENRKINEKEIKQFIKNERDVNVVLLLRNPYNQLSSAWKVYNKDVKKITSHLKFWPIYARHFINENRNYDFIDVRILYDKFCTDEHYVKKVFEQLNIHNIEFNKESAITYQKSSFNEQNHSRKCYGTLNDCIFHDDPNFLALFDVNDRKKRFKSLWKKVLNK